MRRSILKGDPWRTLSINASCSTTDSNTKHTAGCPQARVRSTNTGRKDLVSAIPLKAHGAERIYFNAEDMLVIIEDDLALLHLDAEQLMTIITLEGPALDVFIFGGHVNDAFVGDNGTSMNYLQFNAHAWTLCCGEATDAFRRSCTRLGR